MKNIVFDSVKLPYSLPELAALLVKHKNIENKIDVIQVDFDCHLPKPANYIQVNGYIKQLCDRNPRLICNPTRYSMSRCLYRSRSKKMCISLSRIIKEAEEQANVSSLSKMTLCVTMLTFIIHSKKYSFKYHPPAKALVLKKIKDKDIGRLNQVQIDALICPEGDLFFCAPSHCTKIYKEVWVCK